MAPLLPRCLFSLTLLTAPAFAQELPQRNGPRDFDPESKLMLNDLPDIPLPAPYTIGGNSEIPAPDVVKLEAELERAKKNAAWRERLYKSGVLSKVEAEQGALKVGRIMKDLENGRLQAATRDLEEKRKQTAAGALSKEALIQAENAFATVAATAHEAQRRWDESQRQAAELRLQRERKLLALGAGSRSAVKRAETALQGIAPRTSP